MKKQTVHQLIADNYCPKCHAHGMSIVAVEEFAPNPDAFTIDVVTITTRCHACGVKFHTPFVKTFLYLDYPQLEQRIHTFLHSSDQEDEVANPVI